MSRESAQVRVRVLALSAGIEPAFQDPQSCVLSVELREQKSLSKDRQISH